MKIAGITETNLTREAVTTNSIAVGNWRVRLANALAIHGYATVDLRNIDRAPFVPLGAALDQAEQQYTTVQDPSWQAIGRHLLTLKVLGAETVALRARKERLLIVVQRLSPDGRLEIDEAVAYHSVLQQWADTLSDYLPVRKLTESESQRVEQAKDWVGRNSGVAALGSMAGRLVSIIAKSSGQGCCITVHPIAGAPSPSFVDSWVKTDLTREKFVNAKIQCANYLWNVSNGRLFVGGASGLESPLTWNFEPQAIDLEAALSQVNDQ